MMEFAPRPFVRPPSSSATSFHPLHILRPSSATSTAPPPPPPALPIPRPSTSFGQLSDYRLRSDIRIVEDTSNRKPEQARFWDNSTARRPSRPYSISPPQPPSSSSRQQSSNFRSQPETRQQAVKEEEVLVDVLEEEKRSTRKQQLDDFWKNSLTRLPSPPTRRASYSSAGPQPVPTRRRNSSCRMGATMTVPPTINNTKGAMADFAAQITCLFWFESTGAIHRIAELKTPLDPSSIQPIARHAVPEIGFRKWVATVLSTTQVSQNVILLALLFVYRLKKLNPSVQGKPGSEFRLFTVALMLGNKYLDDNTYTNKTWAEVSGITVGDIHVMEVEFLSNMRYGLYVGDQEWKDWHTNLGKYWDYWDKASRLPLASPPQPQPMSPTSNGGSPAFAHLHAPPPPLQPTAIAGHQLFLPAPVALDPPHVPSISMPIPDFDSFSRKRSIDYASVMQPPSKRVTRSQVPKLSVNVPQFPVSVPTTMPPGSAPPRLQPLDYQLPLPSNRGAPPRTMDTHPVQLQQHPLQIQQQQQHHSIQLPQQQQQQQQQQQHPQLPLPSARPMPVVSHSSPSASGPPVHFDFSPYSARQTSPYSAQHSVASSPITPNFSSQRSPTCWILGNRHSPYRPVRTVNTLLVPPHLEAPQQIGYDQMHYQPLAKVRSEYKTGVVPYMQPEVSWNHSWSDNNHY